jgi:hypothetical protein
MELSLSLNPDYWGPVFWEVMYLGAAGYSAKPTANEKLGFRLFFDSLRYVLPCAKCRADYDQYLTTSPVTDRELENRNALFAWVYSLHKHVSLKLQKPAFPTLEAMQYSFFPAQTAAQRIVWKRPVPTAANAIQPFRKATPNNAQNFRKFLPYNTQVNNTVDIQSPASLDNTGNQRLASVDNTANQRPASVVNQRPASVNNTANQRPASVVNQRPASVVNQRPASVFNQRLVSVVNQRPPTSKRAWVPAQARPVTQSALDLLSAKLGTFREISQVPKYVKRGCGCRRN